MGTFFIGAALVCALATAGVLATGIFTMGKNAGDEASRKRSQKLMQLRVWLQGAALLFLVLAMLTRGG
jgi:hypothetical protein